MQVLEGSGRRSLQKAATGPNGTRQAALVTSATIVTMLGDGEDDARKWESGVMTAVPGVWEWSGGVGAIGCLEIDFWNVLRSRLRYAIGRFALRAT